MIEMSYDNEPMIHAINILLEESLLESPEGRTYEDISRIDLSMKGKIYRDKLIYEFRIFNSSAIA